jgi:hypothetical protein
MEEERRRLRPLRVTPETLALRFPVQVGPTAIVLFDTNEYSMPPEAIGLSGTLFLYRDRVRIVAGRFESTHARLFGRKQKSLLPEHRSAMVAAVSGKRGKRYLKRQQLLELGEAALPFFKTIDDFDFTFQSTLRLAMLGSYLSPDFVTEGRTLILNGKSSRGKTHLAIAIAYRAIQNGFEALFPTAAALIEDLSYSGRSRSDVLEWT